MLLVPRLDLCRVHRRGVLGRRRQHHHLQVALLAGQAHDAVELGLGHERRRGQAGGHQALLQRLPHPLFELGRRQRRHLAGQGQLVAVEVELALDLELRDRGDVLGDGRIAHRHPGAAGGQLQHFLVDQLVQHQALVFHRLELARVKRLALLLALALALLLEALAELVHAHFAVLPQLGHRPPLRGALPPLRRGLDLGHVVGPHAAQVALVDHQEKGNHQQHDDRRGDPARSSVAQFLQHCCQPSGQVECEVAQFSRSRPHGRTPGACHAGPGRKEEGPWFPRGLPDDGGVDGTRTRDLRRDRPAF